MCMRRVGEINSNIPHSFEIIHSKLYVACQRRIESAESSLHTLTSLPLTIRESGSAFINHGMLVDLVV